MKLSHLNIKSKTTFTYLFQFQFLTINLSQIFYCKFGPYMDTLTKNQHPYNTSVKSSQ